MGDISSHAPPSAGLNRRRSSLVSDSFERASFRSSTDSLLLPRPSRRNLQYAEEESSEGSSHLHSVPLLLALLPAIGGMLFQNGSAVLTDVTLLVLAAIFLNWSVRLPWDWYHSAQSIREQEEAEDIAEEVNTREEGYFPAHAETIVEEGSQDGEEEAETSPSSPLKQPTLASPSGKPVNPEKLRQHASAIKELRLHELMALIACFASPLLGAWLLHHIRGSLSRPSEGLVSDYNLSIFILAAEVRPLSHLLRMIQSRTLYLQRTVATNPYTTASPTANRAAVKDLQTRVDELEAHIASRSDLLSGNGTTKTTSEREKELAKSIEATLRAALQPELDAVTRATRRYEKRATLLGMQTETRLNQLESRVQDAVALAAGAERAQQARARGGLSKLVDASVMSMVAASDLGAWIVWLPIRAAENALDTLAMLADSTVGRVTGLKLRAKRKIAVREGRASTKSADATRSSASKSAWKGKEQSVDGQNWSFGAKKAERRAERSGKA